MHDFRVSHGATELFLIRHADAEHLHAERTDVAQAPDMPLTERGRLQATHLARRILMRRADAVYSSPLKRTRETAHPIAEGLGVEIQIDDRLREVEIAGIGPASLQDLAEIAIAHGGWSHLKGTETSASIRGRMQSAIGDIVAAHPGQRVVVVTHAGAINAYLSSILDLKKDFFFPAGNTSITIVRARETRRLIVTINDTAHLEGLR